MTWAVSWRSLLDGREHFSEEYLCMSFPFFKPKQKTPAELVKATKDSINKLDGGATEAKKVSLH